MADMTNRNYVAMEYIRTDWTQNKGKGTYCKTTFDLSKKMGMSVAALKSAFARPTFRPTIDFIISYAEANQQDVYIFFRLLLREISKNTDQKTK